MRPTRKTGWSSTMPRRIRRVPTSYFGFPRRKPRVGRNALLLHFGARLGFATYQQRTPAQFRSRQGPTAEPRPEAASGSGRRRGRPGVTAWETPGSGQAEREEDLPKSLGPADQPPIDAIRFGWLAGRGSG